MVYYFMDNRKKIEINIVNAVGTKILPKYMHKLVKYNEQ